MGDEKFSENQKVKTHWSVKRSRSTDGLLPFMVGNKAM